MRILKKTVGWLILILMFGSIIGTILISVDYRLVIGMIVILAIGVSLVYLAVYLIVYNTKGE